MDTLPTSAPANRPLRRAGLSFLAGVTVAMAFFAGVVAAQGRQGFSDVPPSSPFSAEINALTDACVAGGYDDGTYRPTDPVSRQAMAAFLIRAGGGLSQGTRVGSLTTVVGSPLANSVTNTPIAEVAVTVPAMPGDCAVPVRVTGTASFFTYNTRANVCHNVNACYVWTTVSPVGSPSTQQSTTAVTVTNWADSLTVDEVFTQPAGTTRTYRLQVHTINVKSQMVAVQGTRSIIAQTAAFGP
ncbi:MAG: S-layer homology domain-containing protein [Acidimicrobiia bacterium]|nr:S-layer homology domain-containing protein [Acidimicrobiia bacterium]